MNSEILDIAEKLGVNFFGYRIPGELPCYGFSPSLIKGIARGFVIAPFRPDEQIFTIPYSECSLQDCDKRETTAASATEISATTKEEYMAGANRIIDYLKANPSNKVVYSRVITGKRDFLLSEKFDSYCKKDPSAFIFCYGTAQTGCWMGCSPETLLICTDNRLNTIALAGTRRKGEQRDWDTKNIEEQRIVTDYIVSNFKSCGLTPICAPTYTKEAGPVEHICTPISASLPEKISDKSTFIETLVKKLSPTPALAGYPKDEALAMIASCESHKRACYGGFVGPYSGSEEFSFFVNLRSMRISPNAATLFVGGGYTHLSDPEMEWQETEIKASTLLQ